MKYALYVLMILVLVNIVIATPDLLTFDSRPKIEATYNESVALLNYSLKSLNTGQETNLNILSQTDRTFTFQPNAALYNGYYDFLVNARDLIGNTEIYRQVVIVNASQTQIFLDKPRTGYSTVETFDIIVGTTKPSDCKYSFFSSKVDQVFDSVDTTKTRFTKKAYTLPDKNARDFFVNCTDNDSLSYLQHFEIGVLKDAPRILSAKAIPDQVVMYPPQTLLKVETSQDAVCTANGKYFDGNIWNQRKTYQTTNSFVWILPANQNKYSQTLDIRCENLAEVAATTKINFSVDPTAAFKIVSVDSPKKAVSNKDSVNLTITTNKISDCYYTKGNNPSTPMNNVDLTDTISLGVISNPGIVSVSISCTSRDKGETNSLIYSFIVDATPPNATSVDGWACKTSELEGKFSAFDNESGMEGYNYTLTGGLLTGASTLSSGFVTTGNITIKNLNLSKDVTYTLSVIAKNNAGLSGSQVTKTVFYNPNATQCLEKNPPTTKLNLTLTRNGVQIQVLCSDSESGCNMNSILFGTAKEKSNCTPTTPGDTTTIQSTSDFCWYVEDNAKNSITRQETIPVLGTLVANCYNLLKDGDETDVDCGGTSCPPCQADSVCAVNKDCISNYCVNAVCKEATCSDGLQNGAETGTDCGGTCQGCEIGAACTTNSDCKSNYCVNSTCTQSSCNDSVKNGLETDLDCGGADCRKCPATSSCKADSDCISGSCEFFSCKEAAVPTTPVVKAPEFPIFRVLLLVLGILVLATGILFMYYFKVDKQSSTYLMILGGAAILFVLIDWFLLNTPAIVPALLSLALVGVAGYFIYTQYGPIMKQLKPAQKAAPPATPKQQAAGIQPTAEAAVRQQVTSPEDMAATRHMIDMIKKQRAEREEKRKRLFETFGNVKPTPKAELEKISIKPVKPVEKIIERLKEAKKPEDVFEKLGKITKSDDFDKLSKLLGKKPDQAFDRLSDILKKKDIFDKLPKTDKGIDNLISGKPIERLRKESKKGEKK